MVLNWVGTTPVFKHFLWTGWKNPEWLSVKTRWRCEEYLRTRHEAAGAVSTEKHKHYVLRSRRMKGGWSSSTWQASPFRVIFDLSYHQVQNTKLINCVNILWMVLKSLSWVFLYVSFVICQVKNQCPGFSYKFFSQVSQDCRTQTSHLSFTKTKIGHKPTTKVWLAGRN